MKTQDNIIKPRVLALIDTYKIGGPGKLLIQFYNNGAHEYCEPMVAGFFRGPEREWQFKDAAVLTGVPFKTVLQKSAFDPYAIIQVLKIVREHSIDIIESHGYKAHVVAFFVSRIQKMPWLSFVHGWTRENWKILFYNWIEKKLVPWSDFIIPVSESLRTALQLKKKNQNKAISILNAVVSESNDDLDKSLRIKIRNQFGIQNSDILLCAVGRLSPEKGFDILIEAMRLVIQQNPQIKLMIVGEGQEKEKLDELIKKYQLCEKIFFTGYQENVSPYYQASDIFCLSSLAEGIPVAALEAMAFSKPVIATHVGGVPEVVVDQVTGYLVKPNDPMGLAKAIEHFSHNPELCFALGQQGKVRVDSIFNPAVRAQKIGSVYQQLLKRV